MEEFELWRDEIEKNVKCPQCNSDVKVEIDSMECVRCDWWKGF